MATHRTVFAGSEFEDWAHRAGLEPGEQFLLTRHLDPRKRTVEAGCGGGRLLSALRAAGFAEVQGFDYLLEFLRAARQRVDAEVALSVQDATRLAYADASCDQMLYLQQVLCFLPTEEMRQAAIRDAFRALRPGGVLVASLLAYRTRTQSLALKPLIAYLALLRRLTFRQRSLQYMPWLRLRGLPNPGALWDRGPYVYWYREGEAAESFAQAGFRVEAIGSEVQVSDGRLLESAIELERAPLRGPIYLVCRKPESV